MKPKREKAKTSVRRALGGLTTAAVLALEIGGVGAAEGRSPVFLPTTITQSGSYILTADISVSSGPAITISAPRVSLDLNGHTVTASRFDSDGAILIDAAAKVVRIENGRIVGGYQAIKAPQQSTLRSIRIDRVEFQDPGLYGIDVEAEYLEVTGCAFQATDPNQPIQTCIYAEPSDPNTRLSGRIEDNTMIGCDSGVHLNGNTGFQVRDNDISRSLQNGSIGISETFASAGHEANLFMGNTISGGSVGIESLYSGNAVRQNVIKLGHGSGIQVGGALGSGFESLVEGNLITGGDDAIFVLAARTLVDRNLAESAGGVPGCGLDFEGPATLANAYRDNMLRNNVGGAVCFQLGATATDAGGNIP